MPQGMSISPQVSAFNQPTGPEAEDRLFKERFTQMAYSVLYSKFADIAAKVVTFKILEVNTDEGKGVGVFIVDHDGKPIYIPVILTDSKLKPIEMFYYKDLNIFLPLTLDWLSEIQKMSLEEMGQGAAFPKEVPQDVNIRDLTLPPITTSGRVGLASADDAKRLFKEAEDHSLDVHPQFLNILKTAPKVVLDGVKLAFERHPRLLQKIAANYGIEAVTGAMTQGYRNAKMTVKVAAVQSGDVKVLTKTASQQQIKDVFGSSAGMAFSNILKNGFAIKDTRPHIEKVAVKVEGPTFLDSPGTEAGWYRLYFADGKPDIYFVIPFPKERRYDGKAPVADYYGDVHKPVNYLVINRTGKEVWECEDVMGEKIHNLKPEITDSKVFKLLNRKPEGGDTPTAKSYGVFINVTNRGVEATKPFEIVQVTTSDGVTKISTDSEGTYIIDGDPSRKSLNYAMKGDLIFVPNTAKFIKIIDLPEKDSEGYLKIQDYKRERKNSVIKDPRVLLRWINRILSETGATSVKVKSAGLNQWWIDDYAEMYPFGRALEKVASLYKISTGDAAGILIDAQKYGRSYSFILDSSTGKSLKSSFEKIAQPMEESPMAYQSVPGMPPAPVGAPGTMAPAQGQEMMMGEGAMPFDPMMMQQQMPAPSISPTDLAIGEAIQGLQQQNMMSQQENQAQMQQLQQKMDMEMQQNQQLVGVLQGIQQRASELTQATGGMIPEGAEQSPLVAAQSLAPTPPEQEPPPPMPLMDQDNLSPELVAQQINPEMVDQAADFNDAGMFDTAAIAMLAAAPVLQDIVSAYVPNLEKAIDNLGRVLLTLWMKENEVKNSVGDEQYISLEDKLRSVFKNMGDIVLNLSHSAMNAQSEADKVKGMTQSGY